VVRTVARVQNTVNVHVVTSKMTVQKERVLSFLEKVENDLEIDLAVDCSTLVDLPRQTHGLQLMRDIGGTTGSVICEPRGFVCAPL